MACGCNDLCNCVIQPGDGIEMEGAGTVGSPLVISATGGGSGITVTDTDSVDLTLTGSDLTAAVRIDPDVTNLLTSSAAGLEVSREAVQDAVGAALDDGLVYNDGSNTMAVRLSADGGNTAVFGTDNGVYVPASGGDATVVNVIDTASVNLTKTGTGPPGDPYEISGVVTLSGDGGNGAAFGTDGGLYVPGVARVGQQRAMGAVAFTWDDGWDTHPAIALAHAERGQKATFYITSNLLGTAQHMPAAAMATMVAQGHEIGCHSADHTDMTTLTAATRAPQWASAATLEGIIGGGYRVRSYAYPLGNNNLTTNQEGYGRFDRLATIGLAQGFYTGANGYAPWMFDAGADFEDFRHGRFPWNQQTHGAFMQLLDMVRRRPVVLTAYAHQIGNSDTPTQVQVDEAMDFCVAHGIPCITSAEAIPGPKIINPGFEDGLNGWNVSFAGAAVGTTTVDTVAQAPPDGMSGTQSLRIISPNTTTSADSVDISQLVPALPNRAYSLSARIRHDAAAGTGRLSVRMFEYNSVGAQVRGALRGNPGSSPTWVQTVVTPTATDIAATLVGKTHPDTRFVRAGLYLQESAGTFYADHVYFGPTEEGLLG